MNENNSFDPEAWQTSEEKSAASNPAAQTQQVTSPADTADDIEIITQRIEAASVDITQGYDNWRDIGFALTSELGENGRSIFHRVSRFHPDYDERKADDQYDKCMRSKGAGVTIKTFFAKAKEAGIDIRTGKTTQQLSPITPKSPKTPSGDIGETGDSEDSASVELPTFSDSIGDNFPDFLKKIAAVGESPQETDALVLGALTVISSCLPNLEGRYDDLTVYPNLFYFLTARASSGKGRLNLCRYLVQPIHRSLKEIHKQAMEIYDIKMAEWEGSKRKERGPKPEKPAQTMLIIPANTSATAVYQLLNDNGGKGLIFETEGDTLANAFESDFGNFSDGFRKAFHHEPISYHRRAGDEDVEIDRPQLSTVLTGTPKQVASLIKDAENGLFSRFMFYRLNSPLVWKNVFAHHDGDSLDARFTAYGNQFAEFYNLMMGQRMRQFTLTEPQCEIFHEYFSQLQKDFYGIFKDDILASVRRLGLICYRIAMILSALRIMEHGDFDSDIVCLDEDFDSAMAIIKVLSVHTVKIFEELKSTQDSRIAEVLKTTKRQKFLDALPGEFDRQDYLEAAEKVDVPPSTAEKWIKAFCFEGGPLEKVEHGKYKKLVK